MVWVAMSLSVNVVAKLNCNTDHTGHRNSPLSHFHRIGQEVMPISTLYLYLCGVGLQIPTSP
ncbi:hypothetical protein FPSE_00571 [Fusarium pseudograminearum CS3096]|uniref:Uncharacterized protein n=1 Tax=Fusarium pseudograminearum (strain CS3096) TaxID=1028729 RepID=K3W3E5_FUSPC|nr:hypothetical protein FPSE_00571 [Fusarium pseudograminearum CS3096]EKJ79260.1 hypothetical protein FPSE_00571 [Fusarium pseudograminearum CS3096]